MRGEEGWPLRGLTSKNRSSPESQHSVCKDVASDVDDRAMMVIGKIRIFDDVVSKL